MAIGPNSSGASSTEVYIAVGPSAPPMIPMLPASFREKPRARAPKMATKIPTCAAAPRKNVLGFDSKGLKSVSAPMPRKIKGGKMARCTPRPR